MGIIRGQERGTKDQCKQHLSGKNAAGLSRRVGRTHSVPDLSGLAPAPRVITAYHGLRQRQPKRRELHRNLCCRRLCACFIRRRSEQHSLLACCLSVIIATPFRCRGILFSAAGHSPTGTRFALKHFAACQRKLVVSLRMLNA